MDGQQAKKGVHSPKLTHEEQDNIFGLSAPEKWHCKIWEYHYSHSVLLIEISNEDYSELFELAFIMVHYISAPSHWQGANFRLMPFESSLQLVRKTNAFRTQFETASPELTERSLNLTRVYQVTPSDNPHLTIMICAANAELVPKNR
jgi:hypothetical protein